MSENPDRGQGNCATHADPVNCDTEGTSCYWQKASFWLKEIGDGVKDATGQFVQEADPSSLPGGTDPYPYNDLVAGSTGMLVETWTPPGSTIAQGLTTTTGKLVEYIKTTWPNAVCGFQKQTADACMELCNEANDGTGFSCSGFQKSWSTTTECFKVLFNPTYANHAIASAQNGECLLLSADADMSTQVTTGSGEIGNPCYDRTKLFCTGTKGYWEVLYSDNSRKALSDAVIRVDAKDREMIADNEDVIARATLEWEGYKIDLEGGLGTVISLANGKKDEAATTKQAVSDMATAEGSKVNKVLDEVTGFAQTTEDQTTRNLQEVVFTSKKMGRAANTAVDYAYKNYKATVEMMEDDVKRIKKSLEINRDAVLADITKEDSRDAQYFKEMTDNYGLTMDDGTSTYDNVMSLEKNVADQLAGRVTALEDQTESRRLATREISGDLKSGNSAQYTDMLSSYETEVNDLDGAHDMAQMMIREREKEIKSELNGGTDALDGDTNNFVSGGDGILSKLKAEIAEIADTTRKSNMINGNASFLGSYARKKLRDFRRKAKGAEIHMKTSQEGLVRESGSVADEKIGEMESTLQGEVSAETTSSLVKLGQTWDELSNTLATNMGLAYTDAENKWKNLVTAAKADSGARFEEYMTLLTKVEKLMHFAKRGDEDLQATQEAVLSAVKDHDEMLDTKLYNEKRRLHGAISPLEQVPEQLRALSKQNSNADLTVVEKEAFADLQTHKQTLRRDMENQRAKLNMTVEQSASFVHGALDYTQAEVEKTGKLANQVLPALRDYAKHKAEDVFNKIVTDLEDKLKAAVVSAVEVAARAEDEQGAAWKQSARSVGASITATLDSHSARQLSILKHLKDANAVAAKEIRGKLENADAALNSTVADRKLVENQMAEDGMSLNLHADSLVDEAQKAVPEDHTKWDAHFNAAESAMGTTVRDEQKNAIASIQRNRREAKMSAAHMANASESALAQAVDDAEEHIQTESDNVDKKYKAVSSRVHGLTSEMQDLAANESQWAKKLEDEISNEAAVAKRFRMVSGSRLERETAIHDRFSRLREIAASDVHGLAAGKKHIMTTLVDEAHKEAQRISNSAQLSAKEKILRLEKVDAWMVSQLNAVADQEAVGANAVETAESDERDARAEALSRAAGLADLMIQADAADGVSHDRSELKSTGMTLDEVVAAALEHIEALATRSAAAMLTMKGEHTTDGNELRASMRGDVRGTEAAALDAETSAEASVRRIHQDAEAHGDDLSNVEGEMKDFGETTAETSSTLNQRLAETKVESEKRLTTMKNWQVAMQASTAGSIELLAELMAQVAATANSRYWKDHQQIADFAARAKEILGSEHHVQLRRIATMGKKVDAVHEKADDALQWAQKYGSLTHDWRRDVVAKLNELSGTVSEDLQTLVAGGKAFKLTLDNAEDYEQKLTAKKLAAQLKNEQSTIDAASETAATAINRAMNLMKRSSEEDTMIKKLEDEFETVHPHTFKNATANIEQLLLSLGDTKTADAVREYLALTTKKRDEITAARTDLEHKFEQLRLAVDEALPDMKSFPALKENAALLEEQQTLSARVKRLAKIVERRAKKHSGLLNGRAGGASP
jgi:hypothetical protein